MKMKKRENKSSDIKHWYSCCFVLHRIYVCFMILPQWLVVAFLLKQNTQKKEEEKALNLLIFPFTKEQENYGK